MNQWEMIVALRGGWPETCDFCKQPYNEQRHPLPEECGMWTCSECWERWEREDAVSKATA